MNGLNSLKSGVLINVLLKHCSFNILPKYIYMNLSISTFSHVQARSLPVSSFVFFPYTVNLNYQSDLLTTSEEIGVVLLGPVSNIVVQVCVDYSRTPIIRTNWDPG